MAEDKLSQRFLRVVLEEGGRADITTIRQRTGMSRGEANYRFEKLEDLGWIEINVAESGVGNRLPPKVAELTTDGEKAIRSGEAGKYVLGKETDDEPDEVTLSKEQLEVFQEELHDLKNHVKNMPKGGFGNGHQQTVLVTDDEENRVDTSELYEQVEQMQREIGTLRETMELLNESVAELKKESDHASLDESVANELRDEQEYLRDWMSVAENHLEMIRIHIENHDEEDLDDLYQQAKKQSEQQ